MSKPSLKHTHRPNGSLRFAVAESPLGWFGIAGNAEAVSWLTFGHHRRGDVLDRASGEPGLLSPGDELPPLLEHARHAVGEYLSGVPVDLSEIPVVTSGLTPFAQAVVRRLRKVPYGETLSYGQLAAEVGRPGAARAVGSVMSRNRIPLLIPCHRVVGAGGALGGFSAPTGIVLKRTLLEMESQPAGVLPLRAPATAKRTSRARLDSIPS